MNKKDNHNMLASNLEVGNTILNVSDITRLLKFYQSGVGLEVMDKDSNEVILGKNDQKIISLSKAVGLPSESRNSAGLYHNAIVFQSRGHLAHTLFRLFRNYPDAFIGSADHFVSEAFYFADPEGNELELYFDKDKSLWEWNDGRVRMGLEYIDPMSYISAYSQENDVDIRHMGHVHLKVGDVQRAKEFYVDTLGFDVTAEMPQALFVSVGGYHHHIGMNSWHSLGAGIRGQTLGLQSIELVLPSKQDTDRLAARLEFTGIPVSQIQDVITFSDPWNNVLKVKPKVLTP